MDDLDLSKSTEIWGDVIRTKKPPEDRPELLVSLNYLPQAERLTVVIMKAKNLETMNDPSVKVKLEAFQWDYSEIIPSSKGKKNRITFL
jgi:hypothetical protein